MERSSAPARAADGALDIEHFSQEMTDQFRMLLSTQRMNKLDSRTRRSQAMSQSQSPNPNAPPSYSSLRNLPVVPQPPTDPRSIRFRNMLITLSAMPMQWENPGLLDEALQSVPLDNIYNEAEEQKQILEAEAASLGTGKKPAWGYQDCVIRALMRWFKYHFFQWVNNPHCQRCSSPTVAVGITAVTAEERAHGVTTTELYKCSVQDCSSYTRFPRYNDPWVLMRQRRGRAGEWVNCFGMLCRAVGSRVRWVWNSEDHVWIEVYSVHRRRWIHVDVIEGSWDRPEIYAKGWDKKMAYCIAFSVDGATDVTRRYVRDPVRHGLQRTRCPEGVLLHILDEIKARRRQDMDKSIKFRLQGEDMEEAKELQRYMVSSLAHQLMHLTMNDILNGSNTQQGRTDPDGEKAREQGQLARAGGLGGRSSAHQGNHPQNPQDPPR